MYNKILLLFQKRKKKKKKKLHFPNCESDKKNFNGFGFVFRFLFPLNVLSIIEKIWEKGRNQILKKSKIVLSAILGLVWILKEEFDAIVQLLRMSKMNIYCVLLFGSEIGVYSRRRHYCV